VRIVEGVVRVGDMVRMMSTGNEYEVTELGVFVPEMKAAECLNPGEVGFLVAQIKEVADAPVGDTITSAENPAPEPLPGYRPANAYGLLRAVSLGEQRIRRS